MASDNPQNSVANFIQKSFQILQNKEYEPIIHWMVNGRQFAIKEIDDFQDTILPKYFRHRNINSFIRQLNMYGFHKSRKDPTKNIFSHPFFLRGQPQLLPLVKRKIKSDQKQQEEVKYIPPTPIANRKKVAETIEIIEEPSKKQIQSMTAVKQSKPEKEQAISKTQIIGSFMHVSMHSFGLLMNKESSPLKGLIEKSCIMQSNPELYLKMREHNSIQNCQNHHDDDNISIQDEIERQRRVFLNRRSGVSILNTCNLLEDFDYQ